MDTPDPPTSPDRPYARLTKEEKDAVLRELRRLIELGLVTGFEIIGPAQPEPCSDTDKERA
jgi:hypothetical protein